MSVLEIAQRLLLGVVVLAPTMALAWPTGPPDDGAPPGRRFPGGPGGGPGDEQPRFPGPPIMAALDSDRDGELSVEEIRNAVAALKSLDRNHDGILDRSELEPRDAGPGGPDGPPDGPHGGGRLGGPPAGGPDGPPGGGPPAGAGRGRPAMGHVIPPFVRDDLSLSDRQQKQIAELEKDVKGKLESILTARQLRQARQLMERGPGGPGGRGPGGRRGPGQDRPRGGGPPPDADDGPPVRPQRPRNQ